MAILLCSCGASMEADETETMMQDAYENYVAGEKAQTIAERSEDFNRALGLYMKLDVLFNPEFGNGKLFYNIANSYFQVEEYPWAIVYYNRAHKLMPRNERVTQNLAVALQKAGVQSSSFVTLYDQAFFFHSKFALPERLQLFFLFSVILLALILLFIWKPHLKLKTPIILAAICFGAMLISVTYTRYFAPIDAIVVESTPLYKDAGTQYAVVSELPILAGNKVQVLDVRQNGHWLKILDPSGNLGYVQNKNIRII